MADDAGQSGDGAANQKGDEKTYTQKELDDRIAAVRKGVEESISKKYADYDELKSAAEQLQELEDAKKSDADKTAEQIAALEKKLEDEQTARQKAEHESLRAQVASTKGLSDAQAKRLVGDTKEDLEADADDLLESFAKPGESKPRRDTKPGTPDPGDEPPLDPDKLADRILSADRIL